MKLIRFGSINEENPGLLLADGSKLDVSAFVHDYDEAFFGTNGIAKLSEWLENNQENCPKVDDDIRLGPPLSRPSKIVCVGLNYAKHAAESGMDIPEEPVLFFKASSAIVGPNDPIIIPKNSEKTDWEVELGFVIGKKAKYVSEAEAIDHVAGYCIVNDVSERSFQAERSGQWTKGKSCDTFGPTGPWMVTRDEISDPQNLKMTLDVNGKRYQDGSTNTMIFGVKFLVHYLSQFFTLHPGDVISTGTPPGVGLGVKPNPVFLKPGDEMHLSIEGLGEQHQKCIAD